MSFDFEFPDGFEHRGRGYDWSRGMSVNAVEAYADGERPISKWTKTAILSAIAEVYADEPNVFAAAGSLTLEGLRHVFLMCSSWHHTSKYFNETDFYIIAENVTTDDIATYLQDRQAGKSALALLAKRTRYLHAHGWQVEHAAWTDARGLHADSGRVNADGQFFATHAKNEVLGEMERIMSSVPDWLHNFLSEKELEKAFSGNIYHAGRKPHRYDYDNPHLFANGETRLVQGDDAVTLQEYQAGAWTDAATYKPNTWLALSQILGYLEYHIATAPSTESCTVELDGIRTYSEQERHWLAAHGNRPL